MRPVLLNDTDSASLQTMNGLFAKDLVIVRITRSFCVWRTSLE